MKTTILQDIETLDEILKDLKRIESKLLDGKVIYAHRDICRIYNNIERHKKEVLNTCVLSDD